MVSATYKWYGEAVKRVVRRAERKGINKVMSNCLEEAKALVPVRTGTLQGSIRMKPAEVKGTAGEGEWGSYQVDYARWVEFGTKFMAARAYLIPSKERNYPYLAYYIREAFRHG